MRAGGAGGIAGGIGGAGGAGARGYVLLGGAGEATMQWSRGELKREIVNRAD